MRLSISILFINKMKMKIKNFSGLYYFCFIYFIFYILYYLTFLFFTFESTFLKVEFLNQLF